MARGSRTTQSATAVQMRQLDELLADDDQSAAPDWLLKNIAQSADGQPVALKRLAYDPHHMLSYPLRSAFDSASAAAFDLITDGRAVQQRWPALLDSYLQRVERLCQLKGAQQFYVEPELLGRLLGKRGQQLLREWLLEEVDIICQQMDDPDPNDQAATAPIFVSQRLLNGAMDAMAAVVGEQLMARCPQVWLTHLTDDPERAAAWASHERAHDRELWREHALKRDAVISDHFEICQRQTIEFAEEHWG